MYWTWWNSYYRGFSILPPGSVRQNGGLRPIGAGEILHKIASKVIVSVLKEDVIKCTGTVQVCAGQETVIEAVIHSMNIVYKDENTDAILLVDSNNTFSSLNRQSFLHNISYLCRSIAIFVRNCNSTPSRLLIVGGTEITSREETARVDLVSMAIYGIGVKPLINILIPILSNEYSASVNVQVYPDDFSAAWNLQGLRRWWSVLIEIGWKLVIIPSQQKHGQ